MVKRHDDGMKARGGFLSRHQRLGPARIVGGKAALGSEGGDHRDSGTAATPGLRMGEDRPARDDPRLPARKRRTASSIKAMFRPPGASHGRRPHTCARRARCRPSPSLSISATRASAQSWLLVAAVSFTSKAAAAVGAVLFFVLLFFSGLWLPRAQMPGPLRGVSDATPTGAGVQAIQDAVAGHWASGPYFGVMTAWVIVCGVLAVRLFRWE